MFSDADKISYGIEFHINGVFTKKVVELIENNRYVVFHQADIYSCS